MNTAVLIARGAVGVVGALPVGGLFADYVVPSTASQHLRNPMWPPHAKFHNAHGIVMGLALAGLTEWSLFDPGGRDARSFVTAVLVASVYWIGMVAAILFPGTAWVDPQFAKDRRRHSAPLIAGASCLCILVAASVSALIGYHDPGR